MAFRYNVMGAVWLEQKLHIVLLVVVPLGMVDVLLRN